MEYLVPISSFLVIGLKMKIDTDIFDLDLIEQEMITEWPSKWTDHRSVAIKYYTEVKRAVIKGIKMADTEQIKLNLIPISTKTMRISLGRYGNKGNQKYWFDWFQKHHPLMIPVIKGTNFGRNRKGSLTMIKTTREIERMLATNSSQEIFDSYYADIDSSQLDFVRVDLDSLAAYIEHNKDTQLLVARNDNHKTTLKNNEQTAKLILTLAHYNKGLLPQIISQSAFGRKYYRGPNLQNAPKIVRHAALGTCYQYDIEASVFTWKLDLSKDLDTAIKLPATIDYLDHKNHHRARLAELIFNNSSEYTVGTIKQVITAVGFGARTTNSYGFYQDGVWTTSALRALIKDERRLKLLFNDSWFQEFVIEQDLMTSLIFNSVKDDTRIRNRKILQTEQGRLSKNKTISFLYQQAESAIIQALEKRLHHQSNEIMLICHDGFYTKHRADVVDLRYELQQYLPHGRLDEIKHKAFTYNPDALTEENQHKRFIQAEEHRIAELFNKTVHKPKKMFIPKNQKNEEYDSGYDDGSKAYAPPVYRYDEEDPDTEIEINELPNDIYGILQRR